MWLKATEKTALRWTCDRQITQSIVREQNSKGHFSLSVTKVTIDRAMKLLRMLIERFEREGWTLDVNIDGHFDEPASVVIMDGERIPFKIREKHRMVAGKLYSWTTHSWIPDGRMAVEFYWRRHNPKEFSDTEYTVVEDKLDDIVAWLRKAFIKVRDERLEMERYHREMEERERQRKELENRRKERIRDVNAVIMEFRRYRKACELREFCSALESVRDGSEELAAKIRTTRAIADWIDPFSDYEDELLSGVMTVDDVVGKLV